jgi:RNA polymerase sigma-70 factor (ECF subfamily)
MEHVTETAITNTEDEFLIQQFKDGNTDAFDALYRRHLPVVYNWVRFLIPMDDVEDVTQEIFIAVFKSLPGFRGQSQFKTWLRTLTNHKTAEFYRMRNRKKEPLQATLSDGISHSEGSTPKKLEDHIVVQRALLELPENYREVILMRFIEDLQLSEIAKIRSQNLEATKSLYRRAIIALRALLDGSL